jgi:hypothetical protein
MILNSLLCGCGGSIPNTVTPPAASAQSTRSEEMRKNYGGKPANQDEIDKAIKAAKAKAN